MVGRELERGALDRLLQAAAAGGGGGPVLGGEAGVGQTTPPDSARGAASDFHHGSAVGVEDATPLPFAALAELTGSLGGTDEALPPAVARALGRLDDEAGDELAAAAGLLALLEQLAASRPVLLVVDDL